MPAIIGTAVSNGAASGSYNLTKTLTAGSTLLISYAEGDGGGTSTCLPTITGGGTWSMVVAGSLVAFHTRASIWRLDGVSAGSTTITVAPNVSGNASYATLSEWDVLAVVDQTATAGGAGSFGTPATVGPTSATTTATELIYAAWSDDAIGAGSTSPSTGYTNLVNHTATVHLAADYKVVTSTGTQSASWGTPGDQWNAVIATFASGIPAATSTTLTGPTTGYETQPSTNFTVGANGGITGTVIVTPSDGGAGGTFTPTTVSINTASPTGTFTYTPASSGTKTISTTNGGGLSNPSSISYVSTALVTTMTGPTLGYAGYLSTKFTVGTNGPITGSLVITPSDGGAGGTFTPSTVSLTNALMSSTFKYTPSSAGTKTISITNSGGRANPSNISYVSTLLVGVAMLDFGEAPGTNVTTFTVLDSTVTGTSKIDLFLMGTDSTPDHNTIEHQFLPLGLVSIQATGRNAGVSFTAQASTPLRLTGAFKARYVIN